MARIELLEGELRSAAAPTLERIRGDRDRSPRAVARALTLIEEYLLEPDFSCSSLYQGIPEPETRMVEAFRSAVEDVPSDYISLARIEIAVRLLLDTEATIETIAPQAGFTGGGALNRACHRFLGLPPGEFRRRARQARAKGLQPILRTQGFWLWRRGELDRTEVERINACLGEIDRQLRVLPSSRFTEPWVELQADDGELFDLQVEPLLRLSPAERLGLARRGAFSCSEAVFEMLSERSRVHGRKSRQRGAELAGLALALVEGNADRLGGDARDLLALAWARFGNARRLAADFEGAESALKQAEQWVAETKPRVRAEIFCYWGSLRLFQRRFPEAAAFLGEGIIDSRAVGDRWLEVDALQQRAALRIYQGQIRAALPDLHAALRLTPETEMRRRLISVQHLLVVQVLLDDFEEVASVLEEALRLVTRIDEKPGWHQIRWAEALLFKKRGDLQDAELRLKETWEGLAAIGESHMMAVVSLELALLMDEQGRAQEALEHASEALPALEALRLPEALGALSILRRSLELRKVQRGALDKARRLLLTS